MVQHCNDVGKAVVLRIRTGQQKSSTYCNKTTWFKCKFSKSLVRLLLKRIGKFKNPYDKTVQQDYVVT
jgi:hypothetical protein